MGRLRFVHADNNSAGSVRTSSEFGCSALLLGFGAAEVNRVMSSSGRPGHPSVSPAAKAAGSAVQLLLLYRLFSARDAVRICASDAGRQVRYRLARPRLFVFLRVVGLALPALAAGIDRIQFCLIPSHLAGS